MTDPEEPTLRNLFRVMNEMRGEMSEFRGEDIVGINARMTADKASMDEMLAGLRLDLSRHSTITKCSLESHTVRFRTFDGKLDELKDQG